MNPFLLVESIKDIRIKIHVIGYRTMGESILVILFDNRNNKVLYSIVIDCFERKVENKKLLNRTEELLENYGLDKISMLCWSHPDADHSRGLEKFIPKHCNGNTTIVVPYGLHDEDFQKIDLNKHDKEYIIKLLDNNKDKLHLCCPISVPQSEYTRIKTLKIKTLTTGRGEPPEIITIDALSPAGGWLANRIFTLKKVPKNDFAITLVISIGQNRLLFCSDIMNPQIPHLSHEFLELPQFIKIAHHGSNHSNDFFKHCTIDPESTHACLTSFDRKDLPHAETLNKYIDSCYRVDFTGKGKPGYYGEVEYEFDFYDKYSVKISHHGNACLCEHAP